MTAEPKDQERPETAVAEAIPPALPRASSTLTLGHMAAGLFAVACVAGAMVAVQPQDAGFAGLALLVGITAIGAALFYIVSTGNMSPGAVPGRLFGQALDADPKPVCMTAPDGAAIYANRAWRAMFGQSPTGGIVLPVVAFSADDESAQKLYRLVRAASLKEAREEDLKLKGAGMRFARVSTAPISKSGHAIWRVQEPNRRPLQAVDAPRQNVVVQFRTMETRPKTIIVASEADLQSVSERFQGLFAHAPVGIAMLDKDGRIVEANATFTGFAAPGQVDIKGRLFLEFLRDASSVEMKARLIKLMQGEGMQAPADIRFKGGGERTANLYASALTAATDAGVAAAVVYLVDTSDQTQLETQFAQSQKMQAVGQLAGGVAHDFNNHLTVINGVAELLMQRHPPGDPSFQDIHQIRSTGLRAAGLVRQLLAFSRQQTLEPQVVSVTDIVSDWSITLRRLIGERVKLKVEHGRDLWPVMADPNQLGNVLINLAVNARDAMASGGALSIRTSNATLEETRTIGPVLMPLGEYICIEVEDTGIGIPKENLSKVFEPFFTTKEKGHGTGLGLSSVYGIVKQTGGYIFPESEVGKGTIFRIYLPRYRSPDGKPVIVAKSEIEAERSATPRDLTGHGTILLVEDEAAVRDFAARALTMRGYKVLEAASGEEALEVLREYEGLIDLLVSDVVMPGMDGPTLVKTIRVEHPNMRIMFMSGYAEEAFSKAGERIQDFHFLPKPFSLKQLTSKVKDVIEG